MIEKNYMRKIYSTGTSKVCTLPSEMIGENQFIYFEWNEKLKAYVVSFLK